MDFEGGTRSEKDLVEIVQKASSLWSGFVRIELNF